MKLKYTALMIVCAGLAVSSCKKTQTEFPNPYAGGKPALGIVTDAQQIAVPESGLPGTIVSITATGLVPHKDQLKFLFNGVEGIIKEVTATGIKVEVPAQASTGVTSFVVGSQLVFGPLFTVQGKVNIDPTFATTIGADNAVMRGIPAAASTSWIITGYFQNYDNKNIIKRINRVTRILSDGAWDRSFTNGEGANSAVNDIAQVGPYYYPVGEFTAYAQQGNISRITRIATSGLIDTMQVTTYLKKTKYVPRFNGGVAGGAVGKIFASGTDKMILTGLFSYYVKRDYAINSYDYKDSTAIDSTTMVQLMRLDDTGALDKTWRFDPNALGYRNRPGRSLPGANGSLQSFLHTDGKLICWGTFNKFDNVNAGGVVRLKEDGTIDQTFNIGTGADNYVDHVSYNATLNKYLLIGRFSKFNGQNAKYMVMLNYDGSIDQTFTAKAFDGGLPTFGKLLSDGLIVVSGDFRTYDGIARNRFMFINATGALAAGYNNTGNFNGWLVNILETRSQDNKRALLLLGGFSVFDSKPRNNIVRITIE